MVASRAELAEALPGGHDGWPCKILSGHELLPVLERRRRVGLRMCLTHGCFDLLHAEHVEALEFAGSQGKLLVVALNDDTNVRQTKGNGQPGRDGGIEGWRLSRCRVCYLDREFQKHEEIAAQVEVGVVDWLAERVRSRRTKLQAGVSS